MFDGIFTAIVTPFKNNEIDFDTYKKLIEFQIENGVHGIVPCGTTGESATQTHEEHEEIIKVTVETVAKRVKVIAGAGSNNTKEAIRLTKFAEKIGADGALIITPYYNKPTQEGLFQHFKAINDVCDIPIVAYNVPGRTGTNMLPETTARISELKNVVGIKEASGNMDQITKIKTLTDKNFDILSGEDSIVLPILAIGGNGVISASANVVPKMFVDMYNSFINSDLETAQQINIDLYPICKSMFLETNPIPAKQALELMGKCSSEVRLPLYKMSDSNKEKLISILKAKNII